ncbi:MAG: ABC transporter permease [Oscillospiraceae bacterium]|nr:ABC transporter permease [Oscillospiraceae bacterium]
MRAERRTDVPLTTQILARGLAIALALLTGGLFILMLGHSPQAVYASMLTGALGSATARVEMFKLAIPLLITALGITLAFRMRFWNIGAEGQICLGAIAAAYFALYQPHWPAWLLFPAMFAAAALAGGLWGAIPAWFKARFGTNETLFTLMMNYIALYTIQFLREGPWKNPQDMGFPKIARFAKEAQLPRVLGLHAGWIAALVLLALVYVYLRYSKQGYEISVVGENENTARYAGMNVRRIILRTMFLSGAVCGVAGMLQATGADRTLTDTVAGGVGFSAITVAWLSHLHPLVMLPVSLLFAVLEKGSGFIESVFGISAAAADVLQGILLFFVLGCEFFISFRLIVARKEARHG